MNTDPRDRDRVRKNTALKSGMQEVADENNFEFSFYADPSNDN